jgi:hypothetical protein
MKEQLISFETAKLAKEKGFNIECKYRYFKVDKHSTFSKFHPIDSYITSTLTYEEDTSGCLPSSKTGEAPTQSLLQKWLREVHQIYVQIETDQTTYPKFCYSISRFIGNPNNLSEKEWYWDKLPYNENWSLHRKYEEALEEGLQNALKLI